MHLLLERPVDSLLKLTSLFNLVDQLQPGGLLYSSTRRLKDKIYLLTMPQAANLLAIFTISKLTKLAPVPLAPCFLNMESSETVQSFLILIWQICSGRRPLS